MTAPRQPWCEVPVATDLAIPSAPRRVLPGVWGRPARPESRTPGLGVQVALQGPVTGTDADELGEQDGVLPPAGRDLAALVGVVGAAAIAEAAWNVGQACLTLLHLPAPLAVMFPLVLESAAASCALQDLRDRRRGVRSRALAAGTYLGLLISAVVNALVGLASHGKAGLLEVLPPLVLGALIHLHGTRSERAWRSRARTRPAWRAEQLRQARIESVSEVLPLLTGDDEDGQATVALLRRRLDTATLTPAQALLAAGWHERGDLSPSRRRRLESVAATVWPHGEPPSPPASPSLGSATSPTRSPMGSPVTSPLPSPVGSSTTSSPDSPVANSPRARSASSASASARPTRAAATGSGSGSRTASEAELVTLVARARAERPGAGEPTVRRLLSEAGLSASADRLRAALRTQPSPATSQVSAEAAAAVEAAIPEQSPELDAVGAGGQRG